MERLEKILEIKVDVNDAIKGITNLNKEIDAQRQYQKQLQEQIKELSKDYAANAGEIEQLQQELVKSKELTKDYSSQVSVLSRNVQNQLKVDRENIGSLKQLRAQLSNLTAAYDALSEEERNAAKGRELKDKINEITDSLKGAEEETQRYYRNVGNYENAIKNTIGLNGKFGQTLQNVAEMTKNGVGPALKEATTGVKNVGKETLKLLANPVVAILGAIAVAIMAVVKGIRSSEENTAKWSATMARFKPFVDGVTKACQKFAGVILDIIGGIGKATGAVMKWMEKLPLIGDKMKDINAETERYIKLENDQYELTKRTRDLIVSSAKAERDVAELRTKAKDKEHYTDQERLKFVQEANRIEKEIADEKKAVAEENLRLLQEEAKATENKAEVNDRLKQAEAEVYRAETEYNTKIRELLEQEMTIKNEIAAEDKARAEAKKKADDEAAKQAEEQRKQAEEQRKADEEALKEYNEALLNALQEAEDAEIALIKNQVEQEQELERVRHERRMAELEAKQNEYKNDEEMFNAYARQIEAEQQAHADNMAQISYDARMREADERALEWENRIEEARQNSEDYKALTLEMLNEQLETMTQMQGESDEEYKARQLALKDEILTTKKEQADAEMAIEKAKNESIAGLLGDVAGAIEAVAGENKAAVKMSKVIALAEVAIKQGVAIAEAVASSAKGDPYTYAIRVATAIATTISSMAGAIKSINSVKLARGGRVSGPGTSTSDSIPAMLSNGEYVVNARATSMFPELLETINNLGLGLGAPARMEKVTTTRIERDNAEALVKALQQMPAPVVSVEEINSKSRRVEALERLSRLA